MKKMQRERITDDVNRWMLFTVYNVDHFYGIMHKGEERERMREWATLKCCIILFKMPH